MNDRQWIRLLSLLMDQIPADKLDLLVLKDLVEERDNQILDFENRLEEAAKRYEQLRKEFNDHTEKLEAELAEVRAEFQQVQQWYNDALAQLNEKDSTIRYLQTLVQGPMANFREEE